MIAKRSYWVRIPSPSRPRTFRREMEETPPAVLSRHRARSVKRLTRFVKKSPPPEDKIKKGRYCMPASFESGGRDIAWPGFGSEVRECRRADPSSYLEARMEVTRRLRLRVAGVKRLAARSCGSLYPLAGVILGSMLIASCCLGFSQTAPSSLASSDTTREGVVVTELENGSSIEISKGAVLTIRLETVPGTGYDWKLVRSDTAKLRLVREDLQIAGRSKPGSAAHKIFRFMSEQSGPSTVELHYVRPWEQDASPKKTYRIEVYAK